jgi:hypothetical protein
MIIGRFYLRLTDSGNLLGEWSNNQSQRNRTEGANRTAGIDVKSFVGEYDSVWLEDTIPVQGSLVIQPKTGSFDQLSVQWTPVNGSPNGSPFWGEGMLVNGMLIGDYRDVERIPPG